MKKQPYVSDKNEERNSKRETGIKVLFQKCLEDCAPTVLLPVLRYLEVILRKISLVTPYCKLTVKKHTRTFRKEKLYKVESNRALLKTPWADATCLPLACTL
jgi:hypothetical protein